MCSQADSTQLPANQVSINTALHSE